MSAAPCGSARRRAQEVLLEGRLARHAAGRQRHFVGEEEIAGELVCSRLEVGDGGIVERATGQQGAGVIRRGDRPIHEPI
ncbi:MAG: hypothetical protein WDN28_00065 [Chthoniobacter sp.]